MMADFTVEDKGFVEDDDIYFYIYFAEELGTATKCRDVLPTSNTTPARLGPSGILDSRDFRIFDDVSVDALLYNVQYTL
jgi:hypothetical protein